MVKMKFCLTVLALFMSLSAANNADYGFVLFQDIRNHIQDYYNLFIGGSQIVIPEELGSYMQDIGTYTDDSYYTLLSAFPVSDVMPVVTELPWYEERLSSDLSVAFTKNTNITHVSPYNKSTSLSVTSYMVDTSIYSLVGYPSYTFNKSRSTLDTASTSQNAKETQYSSSIYTGRAFEVAASSFTIFGAFTFIFLLL